MGQSPGLRPLTVVERQGTWILGLLPCAFIYVGLQIIIYLLTWPDRAIWLYILDPPTVTIPAPFGAGAGDLLRFLWSLAFMQPYSYSYGEAPEVNLLTYLARVFYLVAYFTWGRSTGHLALGAYIVDRKTMRQIGTGRKLIRGLFQLITAPIYPFIDLMSWGLIFVDREQRRSINDWVAGTMVVVGDVPMEPERVSWRQRLDDLSRAWRPRPAAEPQG